MGRRIVVFGATGYTGRLTAERLVAQGERPVLAGRGEDRVRALAERLGGLEWRAADAERPASVFPLVEDGDVLVATVGPFARLGEPAVRAAIAVGAVYLDSTGEPAFIRRVFEELGSPAERARAALLPAMGYDYVPGALAGARALEEAGERAVRVDVGYYVGGRLAASQGTRRSAVGVALGEGFAFRDGALRPVRPAERVRAFRVAGRSRDAISVGGAEHFTLPAAYPRLREVNVFLGWFGSLARPLQLATLAGAPALRLPGVRGALEALGERVVVRGAPPGAAEGARPVESRIVAEACDARGERLAVVHLRGPDPYRFTAGLLAWAARRAAHGGVSGTGALGPLEAFGLEALQTGCGEAGLERVPEG
jgi:short subunit dehydrogenase-like uncharacterized protein